MIAHSNFRNTIYVSEKSPRKDLLEYCGRKHADKIYRDKKDGATVHVGYIVAGQWWTFYKEVENPV